MPNSPAADPRDKIEIWATRIGRALAWLVAAFLILNYFTQWFF